MERSSKKSGSDRISSLEEPLLHYILSFLPTLNVIQTCVLSKHWRDIWCSVPTLNFHEDSFKDFESFAKFVDAVLLFRDGSNVTKLSLSSTVTGSSGSKVNGWILYAIRCNLESLDTKAEHTSYQLLSRIFNSESLRELKLERCTLNIPNFIHLPALRSLNVFHVSIKNGELLAALISGSEFLQTLILRYCRFDSSKLAISSSSLQNLGLIGFELPLNIEVSAPNLMFINISVWKGIWKSDLQEYRQMVFKGSLLSLLHLEIYGDDIDADSVIYLINKAANVQYMHLMLTCDSKLANEVKKDFSILDGIQTLFSNLKWLRFLTDFSNTDIAIINKIIKNSPQIETIIFVNDLYPEELLNTVQTSCYELDYSQEGSMWSKYELSHLKYVEIHGFEGVDNEVKMIKFLRENAPVLEKITIMS